MSTSALNARIYSQIFQVMSDSELRKHVLLSPISSSFTSSVQLHIKHLLSQSSKIIQQKIQINFPPDYPSHPPTISLLPSVDVTIQIPEIISKCPLIQPENWKPETKIKDILASIINCLNLFWESTYNFGRNLHFNFRQSSMNLDKKCLNEKKIQNSQSQYEVSLLARLQEVVQDMETEQQISAAYFCHLIIKQQKQQKLNMDQALNKLLSCEGFRNSLRKQLQNGLWIHKILKSSSGLICKKQLIKNSNELLQKIILFSNSDQEKQDQKQEDVVR